jgi:nicotinamide-nucleotide amidase
MALRCEVLAVGTELLLGQINDTNSSWIGEQLALSGIDCVFQAKVGDNHARIVGAMREALARADAVVICGGLGPTHDDITREAAAEVMGVGLHHDEVVAEFIRQLFASRGRRMAENNLRQAQVPDGATVIAQTRGTAPGLICPVGDDKVLYLVPGVPHEMQDMLERAVLPDLRRRSGEASTIASRTLRTWGESESGLNERLDDLIAELDAAGNPTLAFLASGWEGLKVRLTAKGADAAAVTALLDRYDARIRAELGTLVFGVDADTMESVVLDLLRARGLSLGLAESVTGGLVGARITAVPGASSVFRGSIVSYASEVKFSVLGVPEGPVVNPETAAAMAVGAQRVLGADVALGLTGVAGPDEQDGQPVGTLHVGLAIGDEVTTASLRMPGQREQMRQMSVISALDLLRRALLAR